MVLHTHHENEYPWNLKSKIREQYSMNKFRSSSTNHFSFSFHLTFHHPFSQTLCYPYLTQPNLTNTLQPTKPDPIPYDFLRLSSWQYAGDGPQPRLHSCAAVDSRLAAGPLRSPRRCRWHASHGNPNDSAVLQSWWKEDAPHLPRKKKVKLGFLGWGEKVSFFEFSLFFFKLAFEKNWWLVCRCSCFISILVNHVFLSVRTECTCLTQKDQSYQHDTTKGFIYSLHFAEKSNMEMTKIVLSRNCKK